MTDRDLYFVDRDTDALLDLRARVWGGAHPHTDARFMGWLFAATPPGQPSGIMIRKNDAAIGFAGLCTKRLWAAGREAMLAHGLDYMIAPDLSDALAGRVALRVPQHWIDLARAHGFASGVVFPNANSMRILTSQRIGFNAVFQPDLLIRPLPTARFTERLRNVPRRALSTAARMAALASWIRSTSYGRPAGEAVEVNSFDDGFDALWQRVRDDVGIATIRDRAHLEWRFGAHPVYRYTTFAWRRGADCEGYVVCTPRRLFGVETMLLVDLLTAAPQTVAPALIDVVVEEARRRGMGMVVTLAVRGSQLHDALKMRGFINVPSRLDPKRFTATEIVFDEALRPAFDAHPRYFTWSDMDVA